MNSIIKKSLLVLIFLLPFFFLKSSLFPFIFPKVLFIESAAIILGVLWLIGRVSSKKNKTLIPKNIVLCAFFIYLIVYLLSGLSGIVPSLSFWGSIDRGISFVFLLSLFILAVITSSLWKTLEDWYKLFIVFISSGILFTIGIFLSEAGVHIYKGIKINITTGFTLGNSSFAGIYLAFIFFVSLGIFLSSKIKSYKILGVIGALSALLNPMITGFILPGDRLIGEARTSFYGIILGLIVFALYFIFRKISSSLWKKIFLGVIGLTIVMGIFVAFNKSDVVKEQMIEKVGGNRLVFWDIAYKGFKEKPVLGWGDNTYHLAYAKFFNPIIMTPGYSQEFWVDRSHSIYFDELFSGGIIGFLSLMFLYGVMLFGLIRRAILEKGKEHFIFISLFSSIVAFLIGGVMLFQTIIGWFIVAILIAFIANFCFKDRSIIKKEKDFSEYKGIVGVISVLIGCVLLVYIVFKPYGISHKLTSLPTMNPSDRFKSYEKIGNSYIGNTLDLGRVFMPFQALMRKSLNKELSDNEKQFVIKEVKQINTLLDHSIKKQDYLDLKTLTALTGYYSMLIALTDGKERQDYYKQGVFYVDKMFEVSPQHPADQMSKDFMDFSLKYGPLSFQVD